MNVAIENLEVEIAGNQVLHGVSLEVQDGEFVTMLGPSGSGKTTTLNVLAGFLKPSGGRVVFGDSVVDDLPAHQRNIGFVFQNYALFPHMTVAENIAFPLIPRGVGRRDRHERAKQILELVQLPHLVDRKVRSLSGGQQQRIALARALVFEPGLLLLDEPLAALDKQLRDAMQLEIRAIHERTGMTTVAVTHDQVEAMTMSDRVAILDGGRISQVGTPIEVYQRPQNLFVASFLGEANLLEAEAGRVPALGIATQGARDGVAVIRPEDLEIRPTETPTGTEGIVEDVSFQGSRTRTLVRLRTGERLIASEVVTEANLALRPSDEVVIRTRSDAAHAIAEDLEKPGPTGLGSIQPAGLLTVEVPE